MGTEQGGEPVADGDLTLDKLADRVAGVKTDLHDHMKHAEETWKDADVAHGRLRSDFREHRANTDSTLGLTREKVATLDTRVTVLEKTPPPDVMKLRFSTQVVLGLVFAVASAIGAAYGIGAKVAGKIDDLGRQVEQQAVAQRKQIEDQRNDRDALKKQMDDVAGVTQRSIDGMVRQLADQAAARDSAAKLSEERATATQRAIDGLTRNMELLKYEQQRLREDMTKPKGGGV